eukprot:4337809-Prymnesium_polylepis.1
MDPKLEAVLDAAESQATDESVETVAEPKPAQAPSQSSSDEEFAEACESADDRDASAPGVRPRPVSLEAPLAAADLGGPEGAPRPPG